MTLRPPTSRRSVSPSQDGRGAKCRPGGAPLSYGDGMPTVASRDGRSTAAHPHRLRGSRMGKGPRSSGERKTTPRTSCTVPSRSRRAARASTLRDHGLQTSGSRSSLAVTTWSSANSRPACGTPPVGARAAISERVAAVAERSRSGVYGGGSNEVPFSGVALSVLSACLARGGMLSIHHAWLVRCESAISANPGRDWVGSWC